MKIEIWSDIMCPFCYIGKRHFEAALKQFNHDNAIEIVWKSFQLDPTIPETAQKGLTTTEYLAQRKGMEAERIQEMNAHVTHMATNAGLDYHLDTAILYNSFKAHRIIQLAKTKGLGDIAEEAFFYAHFTLNKDLGDDDILLGIGKEIGFSESEINTALTDDQYALGVRQDIQEAQQIGVTGVPFFVFNRKYAVSGAQPTTVFLDTLHKSFAEWRNDNPLPKMDITGGNVCTPDGECG